MEWLPSFAHIVLFVVVVDRPSIIIPIATVYGFWLARSNLSSDMPNLFYHCGSNKMST